MDARVTQLINKMNSCTFSNALKREMKKCLETTSLVTNFGNGCQTQTDVPWLLSQTSNFRLFCANFIIFGLRATTAHAKFECSWSTWLGLNGHRLRSESARKVRELYFPASQSLFVNLKVSKEIFNSSSIFINVQCSWYISNIGQLGVEYFFLKIYSKKCSGLVVNVCLQAVYLNSFAQAYAWPSYQPPGPLLSFSHLHFWQPSAHLFDRWGEMSMRLCVIHSLQLWVNFNDIGW